MFHKGGGASAVPYGVFTAMTSWRHTLKKNQVDEHCIHIAILSWNLPWGLFKDICKVWFDNGHDVDDHQPAVWFPCPTGAGDGLCTRILWQVLLTFTRGWEMRRQMYRNPIVCYNVSVTWDKRQESGVFIISAIRKGKEERKSNLFLYHRSGSGGVCRAAF